MITLFLIDIDGTIAEASRRFKSAGPEPSRNDRAVYDAWVRNVQNERSLLEDEPVPGMQSLVLSLMSLSDNKIHYLTSREEKWRGVTAQWLVNNGFPLLPITMRDNGDYSEGSDYKESAVKFLKQLYNASEVVLLDDDEHGTIEAKCKANGWVLLKARSGGQK